MNEPSMDAKLAHAYTDATKDVVRRQFLVEIRVETEYDMPLSGELEQKLNEIDLGPNYDLSVKPV